MGSWKSVLWVGALSGILNGSAWAGGTYYEVTYPPSTAPGELQLAVTYTLWVPDGAPKLRGIIVHQHGCGSGANSAGITAASDLHWQALARKWDCALLGPYYKQTAEGRPACELWSDPRLGSKQAFLKAIDDFAAKTGHPELKTAPWCLWGHSGGGFWVSLMQTLAPERIVAAWLRSGSAFPAWEDGWLPRPQLSEAVYQIPTMCNPGIKESFDERRHAAWLGSVRMFNAYRAKGALIGFTADPRSGHDCGDSRYLAIPYFDACLAMRLPDPNSPDQSLRPIDTSQAWLANPMDDVAVPASKFRGKVETSVWLPNAQVARAWMEYVKQGSTNDTTPPPAPTRVTVSRKSENQVEITWDAEADFESGLAGFIIERDGKPLVQVPEKAVGKFGRPLFQTMSYHDTPERPLPAMRYVDEHAVPNTRHSYQVIAVNSVGLRSELAKPANP
jgi:hypothetical protein